MATVNVICQGYKGAYQHLNGVHQINVTRRKFLLATLTLGFQRFGNFAQAGPRLLLHRFGIGLSAISYFSDEFGDLRLSPDHQSLDGSEKGGMSYWQGMVFAKLAAAEVLGIRWLQHADAMEKEGRLHRMQNAFPGSSKKNRRADMAGRDDQLRWHVVEAKGFSRNLPPNAIQNAKDQAGVVSLIDNTVPETTSAAVSCLWKSPIEIVLDDPAPSEEEEWLIGEAGFWRSYYGGLVNYMRSSGTTSDSNHPGFVFASLPPFLGVDEADGKALKIGLPEVLLMDVTSAPKIVSRLLENSELDHVAEDGIALLGRVDDFV